MDEDHFWARLEGRLTEEPASTPIREVRSMWCDGFMPEAYAFDAYPARIAGDAWIDDGQSQAKWRFLFYFDAGEAISKETIVWESVLPPSERRDWVQIDRANRTLTMNLCAEDMHDAFVNDILSLAERLIPVDHVRCEIFQSRKEPSPRTTPEVRLIHGPTGEDVSCWRFRTREENTAYALISLRLRLDELEEGRE